MLVVVANGAAINLLKEFLDESPKGDDEIAVWESTVPIRITREDVKRYLYGNGDLMQIVFVGHDAIAMPDAEQRISPLDERMTLDKD